MTSIKEYPMVFTAEDVRAIQDGSKTQFTELLEPQPVIRAGRLEWRDRAKFYYSGPPENSPSWMAENSRIKVGDRVWVRETWKEGLSETHECYGYRADMKYRCGKDVPDHYCTKWCSSTTMPKAAARIFLEITNVTVTDDPWTLTYHFKKVDKLT